MFCIFINTWESYGGCHHTFIMKFHHSFISWWLCGAVLQYFHTKTIIRMKALSRLLQRSADQWVLFFICFFFWVLSYLIFLVWLPLLQCRRHILLYLGLFFLSFSLGRFAFWCFPFDISSVDFLFRSIFYLICLVTFYLICSHWRSWTHFILNIIIVLFQLWCHSPLWTLAPSRLQHHQTKSKF